MSGGLPGFCPSVQPVDPAETSWTRHSRRNRNPRFLRSLSCDVVKEVVRCNPLPKSHHVWSSLQLHFLVSSLAANASVLTAVVVELQTRPIESIEAFTEFLDDNPEVAQKVAACQNYNEVADIAKANGINVSGAELTKFAAE